jgi:peptide/nickel transport system permease protein
MMAATTATDALAASGEDRSLLARARTALGALVETAEGKIAVVILVLFVLVLILGPAIAPYGPTKTGVGVPDGHPSAAHLLGTDSLGRDVFSRLLTGARSVIAIPLVATCLAFLLGGLGGMVAGYRGGATDRMISSVVDILLSLPALLVVLVIITAAGGSSLVVIVSAGIVYAPRVARILRGATQGIAASEYVQAAQARGERTLGIVLREILPNIAPTVFVEFAVRLTYIIIFVATLNFLGLAAQPPSSNWGLMVSESRTTIVTSPVATLAPALALGLLSVSISLLADAVTQRRRIPGAEEYTR